MSWVTMQIMLQFALEYTDKSLQHMLGYLNGAHAESSILK